MIYLKNRERVFFNEYRHRNHLVESQKKTKQENKMIYREIMAKYFPILVKYINLQTQESGAPTKDILKFHS